MLQNSGSDAPVSYPGGNLADKLCTLSSVYVVITVKKMHVQQQRTLIKALFLHKTISVWNRLICCSVT